MTSHRSRSNPATARPAWRLPRWWWQWRSAWVPSTCLSPRSRSGNGSIGSSPGRCVPETRSTPAGRSRRSGPRSAGRPPRSSSGGWTSTPLTGPYALRARWAPRSGARPEPGTANARQNRRPLPPPWQRLRAGAGAGDLRGSMGRFQRRLPPPRLLHRPSSRSEPLVLPDAGGGADRRAPRPLAMGRPQPAPSPLPNQPLPPRRHPPAQPREVASAGSSGACAGPRKPRPGLPAPPDTRSRAWSAAMALTRRWSHRPSSRPQTSSTRLPRDCPPGTPACSPVS